MMDARITTIPVRRILVALDGSRLAEVALPPAIWLAHHLGSTLTLLHVIEHAAPGAIHGDRHLTELSESEQYLQELIGRFRDPGLVIESHVHPNPEHDVARSIAEHAEELGTDVIVMTTHGGGGLRGLLSGRIAQQVMQRSSLPVLVVRPEHHTNDGFTCDSMLVTLDGTLDSENALPWALTIAQAAGASVHLLRVVTTRGHVRGERTIPATMLPGATMALLDIQEEHAQGSLRAIVSHFPPDLSVVVQVRRGDIVEEIASYVRKLHIDMVVLSTHGRSGIEGIVAGSVASKVTSRVDRPLLLIRAPQPPRGH